MPVDIHDPKVVDNLVTLEHFPTSLVSFPFISKLIKRQKLKHLHRHNGWVLHQVTDDLAMEDL